MVIYTIINSDADTEIASFKYEHDRDVCLDLLNEDTFVLIKGER
jgi:hypothetical protein